MNLQSWNWFETAEASISRRTHHQRSFIWPAENIAIIGPHWKLIARFIGLQHAFYFDTSPAWIAADKIAISLNVDGDKSLRIIESLLLLFFFLHFLLWLLLMLLLMLLLEREINSFRFIKEGDVISSLKGAKFESTLRQQWTRICSECAPKLLRCDRSNEISGQFVALLDHMFISNFNIWIL